MSRELKAVVVDDLEAGNTARRVLEKCGFRVIQFVHPQDALDYLEGECGCLDLLVANHRPPRMRGLGMAQEAKESNPEIRRIVITCEDLESLGRERAFLPGFEFLAKPYQPVDLVRVVRR